MDLDVAQLPFDWVDEVLTSFGKWLLDAPDTEEKMSYGQAHAAIIFNTYNAIQVALQGRSDDK